jgi:hypothetical protein
MTTSELREIAIRCLERPKWDNTNLGKPYFWMLDNLNALARFWKECGHALGLSEEDEEELTIWIRCQHDMELAKHRSAL